MKPRAFTGALCALLLLTAPAATGTEELLCLQEKLSDPKMAPVLKILLDHDCINEIAVKMRCYFSTSQDIDSILQAALRAYENSKSYAPSCDATVIKTILKRIERAFWGTDVLADEGYWQKRMLLYNTPRKKAKADLPKHHENASTQIESC